MLGMPYCILCYAKDIVKPKRKYNGKIDWILFALNIVIMPMIVWSFALYVAPAFAHYVMLITVRNPLAISFTSDVVFLSVITACLIVFCWLKRRRWQARRQRSEHWQATNWGRK